MKSTSIQRRLRNLEATYALALAPEYPPFTQDEIESIEQRWCAGEKLTRVELHRIEKQTPIIWNPVMRGLWLDSRQRGECSSRSL